MRISEMPRSNVASIDSAGRSSWSGNQAKGHDAAFARSDDVDDLAGDCLLTRAQKAIAHGRRQALERHPVLIGRRRLRRRVDCLGR